MIVVTGARGQVGSRVNTMLEQLGVDTLPVARTEGRTAGGRPFHVADLARPDTLAAALRAADQLFLYPDFGADLAELLAASRLRRVVLLSSSWVEVNPATAIADKHRRAEALLASTGVEFTILRPDTFMTNDHFWLPELRQGTVATAFPEALTAPIACADIAATAVAALHTGRFGGDRLLITGDEALTQRERIVRIAGVLGTPVEVDVIGEDAMRERFGRFMPQVSADEMIDGMTESLAAPLAPEGGFARVMGRPAVRYDDWLRGDESRFRASAPAAR